MKFIRIIARPLLASVFIADAVDALRNPDEHAEKLEPFDNAIDRARQTLPALPGNNRTLVRIHAGITLGAGLLFSVGKAPRTTATILACCTAPAAILSHPIKTRQQRQHNLPSLLAKTAAIAGLTFAAADRQGSPSLGWRYRKWQEHRADLKNISATSSE